jgi:hypothetical protein
LRNLEKNYEEIEMATKKRMTIRMGILMGAQVIEEDTGAITEDYIVNNWGGAYFRLEPEEAVLFQAALNEAVGDDLDALTKKCRAVGVQFGLEMIGQEPDKPGKPVR